MIGNGEIAEVKAHVRDRRGWPEQVRNHQVLAVLEAVGGDVDLAATALVMTPRPDWVAELVPDGAGLPIRGAA